MNDSEFKQRMEDQEQASQIDKEMLKDAETMKKLRALLSEQEIKTLIQSAHIRIIPGLMKVPEIDFEGTNIKFGLLTDLHIGSVYFQEDLLYAAYEIFEKESCEFICYCGDITEGISRRQGHVRSLTHIGYKSQRAYAVQLLSQSGKPSYLIDGNHDRWFANNANTGALIVEDICNMVPNAHFLGMDEGDITLKKNVVVRLWHGEDGATYALSYRGQKKIESISGGDKPHVLLAGHAHKSGYFFIRNIHTVESGCIELQTDWMKATRKEAHTGFWVIELRINDKRGGVNMFAPKFFPFYI